jgi:hypothetical protein
LTHFSLRGLKLMPSARELLPLTIKEALCRCLPSRSGVRQTLTYPTSQEDANQEGGHQMIKLKLIPLRSS